MVQEVAEYWINSYDWAKKEVSGKVQKSGHDISAFRSQCKGKS